MGASIQTLSASKMSKLWTTRKGNDLGRRCLMSIAKSADGKQSFLKDFTSNNIHEKNFSILIGEQCSFFFKTVQKRV